MLASLDTINCVVDEIKEYIDNKILWYSYVILASGKPLWYNHVKSLGLIDEVNSPTFHYKLFMEREYLSL